MQAVHALKPAPSSRRLAARRARAAVARFRLQRQASVLLVLSAGVAAQQGALGRSPGWGLVLCGLLLTAARWLAWEAESQWVVSFAQSAMDRHGMDHHRATIHARHVLELLLVPRAHAARVSSRNAMNKTDITITNLDRDRLGSMLQTVEPPDERAVVRLDDELARAEVVAASAAPNDLVTMNSRVRFVDELAGTTREITLVYPDEADPEAARVSVLSPVGSALLGLRVGQVIEWPLASGRRGRFRVLSLPYQPEAAGHYHL